MDKIFEILNGTLLSDASIREWKGKYYYYSLVAKDKNFLEWVQKIFRKFGLSNTYIVVNNKIVGTFSLGFYMNRFFENLSLLRSKWYTRANVKTIKTVPQDLKLTPLTLLFWYLGDGSFVRRKNDSNRVPYINLCAHCFSERDIRFLIQKLKELDLNFLFTKDKSGFTGKFSGYRLYSKVEDGTPFRFFQVIGFNCPKEIANCITRREGNKFYRFKDKWPTEEDWLKILSNVKEVGQILRKRRLELDLSQRKLAEKVGIRRENIRDVELEKRCFSVKNFRKVLGALGLTSKGLLNSLSNF